MEHLTAHQLTIMLVALGLLIGLARLLGEIAQRLRQPSVLGELLAGVLLGPTVLGEFAPAWHDRFFPLAGPNALVLDSLATFALVLFLFVAGMEVDLSIVWRQGPTALKVGLLGTAVPFAIGFGAGWQWPAAFGRAPEADPLVFALFLATAMAISALPVIAKTLMDLNLYRTDFGMVVISAAMLDDLIGWTVFSVILGMLGKHGSGEGVASTIFWTLVYAGLVLTAGRWLIHRALPLLQAYAHWPAGVLGFALMLALLGAAATEHIGIHAIFGSFLVGIALGSTPHLQERTRVMIDEFVSYVLAPIFFASIGLRVNFATMFEPRLVWLVLSLACLVKLLGAVSGARWGGLSRRDSWGVGFAMNARGAMEIVLGVLALEAGMIEPPLFVALVVTAIVTSAIGGPLIQMALRRPKPATLTAALSSKLFAPQLAAGTRRESISELVQLVRQQRGIDAVQAEQAVWDREALEPTGLGGGAAVPRAELPGLREPIVAFGVSDAGIDFDAPDGQPAHAVFLVLTPPADAGAQRDLCAGITAIFRQPGSVERILRAQGFTEILAVLKMLSPRAR